MKSRCRCRIRIRIYGRICEQMPAIACTCLHMHADVCRGGVFAELCSRVLVLLPLRHLKIMSFVVHVEPNQPGTFQGIQPFFDLGISEVWFEWEASCADDLCASVESSEVINLDEQAVE